MSRRPLELGEDVPREIRDGVEDCHRKGRRGMQSIDTGVADLDEPRGKVPPDGNTGGGDGTENRPLIGGEGVLANGRGAPGTGDVTVAVPQDLGGSLLRDRPDLLRYGGEEIVASSLPALARDLYWNSQVEFDPVGQPRSINFGPGEQFLDVSIEVAVDGDPGVFPGSAFPGGARFTSRGSHLQILPG